MNRGLNIALVAVAGFLYWVALYLYVPTLPTYIQAKTSNLAMVGTILAHVLVSGRASSACQWALPPTGSVGASRSSWAVSFSSVWAPM